MRGRILTRHTAESVPQGQSADREAGANPFRRSDAQMDAVRTKAVPFSFLERLARTRKALA